MGLTIAPVECPERNDDTPFYASAETVAAVLNDEQESLSCGFDDHDHEISAEEVKQQFRDGAECFPETERETF